MYVEDAMSRSVQRLAPTDSVRSAALVMGRDCVGALPVCEGERVVGIVTESDLVRKCMAWSLRPEQTAVRAVMTADVITVEPSATLDTAAELMTRHGLLRLPVASGSTLVGMLTAADVVRHRAEVRGQRRAAADLGASPWSRADLGEPIAQREHEPEVPDVSQEAIEPALHVWFGC